MPSIASINVQIGATITKLVSGLNKAEKRLARSGAKFERLGNSLSQSVSLPLIGIGIAGGKMAADLSDNFSKIENLVGVTGDAIVKLQDGVKKVSGEVGKSQAELSAALFTITSAGIEAGDALEVLEVAAKASVIGMGDTSTIAKAATSIMAAYGSENVSAAQAVNLLTKTVKAGNLAADELAPSIGKLLPIAQSLGISFEELGANIAVMSRLGLSGSESITALKSALGNIQKGGPAAEKALKEVGLSVQGVRDKIRKDGLAATFDLLIEKYKDNTAGLSKLFGSVEGLGNVLGTAGAQGEEYAKILAQMKDGTDIVSSGFENASKKGPEVFRQAMVRLQNVMIEVGNVVIPFATTFAEHLSAIAQGFSNLDGSTQKYIITIGAVLAAVGPVLKVYGTLLKATAAVKGAQAAAALAFSSFSGKVLEAAAAFQKFSAVTKATTIGLVVAAIAGAVAIFQSYNSQLTTTEKIQKRLTDIQLSAAQATVEEKIKTDRLVKTIENVNSSYKDKKKALTELQKISPKYFGNLSTEKINIDAVRESQLQYIDNLKQMAKVQAATDRLIELNKELLQVEATMAESSPSVLGYAKDFLSVGLSVPAFAKIQTASHDNKIAIEAEIEAMTGLISKHKEFNDGTGSAVVTPDIVTPDIDDPETPTGDGPDPEKIYKAKAAIEELSLANEAYLILQNELNSAGATANEWLTAMPESMLLIQEAMEPMIDTTSNLGERLDEVTYRYGALTGAAATAAVAMGNAAKSGETSFRKMGSAALKAAADVVRAYLMESVAAFIADNFKKFGIFGTIGAAAAGAVVGGLFNKVIGSLKIPALAEGGLAYGPSLALVGEGSGTSQTNPEVIAPLDKLKSMLNPQSSAADVRVYGQIMLRGSDMLIMIENATNAQLRKG